MKSIRSLLLFLLALPLGSFAVTVAPSGQMTYNPSTGATNPALRRVDVKAVFGAKGDGITDDTAAINKAQASGHPLYFPAGTYEVGALTATGTVDWEGAGMYVTTIQRISATRSKHSDMVNITGSNTRYVPFVRLANVGFDQYDDGTSAGGGSVYSCVTLYYVGKIIVKDCFFTRGQYHGIKVNQANLVDISHSRFYECFYDGIGIGGPFAAGQANTTFVRIHNNQFENIFGGVIIQVGVNDVMVTDNQFSLSGIQFGQNVTQIVIHGNTLNGVNTYGYLAEPNFQGIFCEGDTQITIDGNQLFNMASGASPYGIYVIGSKLTVGKVTTQEPIIDCTVSNNIINSISNAGIFVQGQSFDGSLIGQRLKITGNIVSNCGSGIVATTFKQVEIAANHTNLTQFSGMQLNSLQVAHVVGNFIYDPSAAKSNSYCGIDIIGTMTLNMWITGNTIVDDRTGALDMRFGIFDEVLNASVQDQVRTYGNVISGAVTGNLYVPMVNGPPVVTHSLGAPVAPHR